MKKTVITIVMMMIMAFTSVAKADAVNTVSFSTIGTGATATPISTVVELNTPDGAAGYAFIRLNIPSGIALNSITSLSYNAKVITSGLGGYAPEVVLNIDADNNGVLAGTGIDWMFSGHSAASIGADNFLSGDNSPISAGIPDSSFINRDALTGYNYWSTDDPRTGFASYWARFSTVLGLLPLYDIHQTDKVYSVDFIVGTSGNFNGMRAQFNSVELNGITYPVIPQDTTPPQLSFTGFRNQTGGGYDITQAIQPCGSVNNSGYIAWEWLLNNVEANPVTYTYKILSGPAAVGFTMDTGDTHIYGGIPLPGIYSVQITGKDQAGNISDPITCSVNYQIASTPSPTPVLVGPPTDKDQCKKDGWKVFNNPTFKNQGECVSYVMTHKEKPGKAWGFARYYKSGYYITFNVQEGKNGKPAQGNIWNITPTRSFYQGDVKCAQIDGNTAYFAAKIDLTNDKSFGPWVLIKVIDGGKLKDQIWAEFATESAANSWCNNPTNPVYGPWNVLMGNLEVKG